MDNEFRKHRAKTIRDMASKADPFVKKRLLDLAESYERAPKPTLSPVPVINSEQAAEPVGGPQWTATRPPGHER